MTWVLIHRTVWVIVEIWYLIPMDLNGFHLSIVSSGFTLASAVSLQWPQYFFLGGLLPHGKEATSSFMHVQVGAGMPGCLDLTLYLVARLIVSLTSTVLPWKTANDGLFNRNLSWEFSPPGTGKTLAYLIPAIEHVIKNPPPGIGVLIIAPSSLWAMSRDMSGHGTGLHQWMTFSLDGAILWEGW